MDERVFVPFSPSYKHALLINNMGGVCTLQMHPFPWPHPEKCGGTFGPIFSSSHSFMHACFSWILGLIVSSFLLSSSSPSRAASLPVPTASLKFRGDAATAPVSTLQWRTSGVGHRTVMDALILRRCYFHCHDAWRWSCWLVKARQSRWRSLGERRMWWIWAISLLTVVRWAWSRRFEVFYRWLVLMMWSFHKWRFWPFWVVPW